MNRKEGIAVGLVTLVIALSAGFIARVPGAPSPTLQTTAVDIEVLNVARDQGIIIIAPNANFTAGFSFAPSKGFVQVTTLLLTMEWNQYSQGHAGDRFSVQLNGRTLTLTAPLVFGATQVTTLVSQDLRLGSNTINITPIAANPSVTTNFLLYEVRLTTEYMFLG